MSVYNTEFNWIYKDSNKMEKQKIFSWLLVQPKSKMVMKITLLVSFALFIIYNDGLHTGEALALPKPVGQQLSSISSIGQNGLLRVRRQDEEEGGDEPEEEDDAKEEAPSAEYDSSLIVSDGESTEDDADEDDDEPDDVGKLIFNMKIKDDQYHCNLK